MDEPSSKRRRTTIASEPLSPSKSTTYASFQSPTRASLSRYNPNLLPAARTSPIRKLASGGTPRRRLEDSIFQDPLKYVLQDNAKETLGASATGDAPVIVNDEAVPENIDAVVNTPTHPTGRSRRPTRTEEVLEEDEDDLPETPEHLRNQPEYKDRPPRGILYHATPTRRNKDRSSRPSSVAPTVEEESVVVDKPTEPEPIQIVAPTFSLEEKERIKARNEEYERLKREHDALLADVNGLETHLDQVLEWKEGQTYQDFDGLLKLINKSSTQTSNKVEVPSISNLLSSFLPFSIPVAIPQTEPEAPIPSHHPLPDKIEDLTMFTPFQINHILGRVEAQDSLLRQSHNIKLKSPSSLLTCTLTMEVDINLSNPRQPTIHSLNIHNLSPWVNRECGVWIRECTKQRDILSLGYGLGRYWEMNLKRARVWNKLQQDFAHLDPRSSTVLGNRVSQSTKSGKRKRTDDLDDLRHLLGCEILVLGDEQYEIKIYWQLQHDWTAAVQSKVSLKLTFLKGDSSSPQAKTLRISTTKTFSKLLTKYGVASATSQILTSIFH